MLHPPLLMEQMKLPLKGRLVLALPAQRKCAVLALRAGEGVGVGGQHSEKKLQPRWRGRARRELSPLSAALQRANKQMPPMWDPIPSESGSRRDRKAAAALLMFNHHAVLLEKTYQEMVAEAQGSC
jgi:hypothetical protein